MRPKGPSLAPHPPHNGDKTAILWSAYCRRPTTRNRNALVVAYQPLVRKCIGFIFKHLPPCVEPDELQCSGTLGLIDAIPAFDPKRGVKFETFATYRIRGAIRDGLREIDTMTRTLRGRRNKVDAADAALEARFGRPPTDEERRRRLGWTRPEYLERTAALQAAQVMSFPPADDGTRAYQERDSRALPPWATPSEDDLFTLLQRGLNRDERTMLVLYYRGNVTMKNIGLRLGLSEARVSQMHADILVRLRERLGGYDYAGSGTTSRGTSDGGEPSDG